MLLQKAIEEQKASMRKNSDANIENEISPTLQYVNKIEIDEESWVDYKKNQLI